MSKERVLSLVVVSATVLVLAVLGLASAFITGIVFSLDGLLLLMVCLMMAGIFALMLFMIAKEQGWIPALGKKGAKAASTAPVAARAASPADAVQPNQATHPVDQTASRPQPAAAADAAPKAPLKTPVKAGEGT
jgi:predicted lipid-binding transport protein (Tim44 family)